MNRKKRRRRRLRLAAFLLAVSGICCFVRFRMLPMVRELATTSVSNEASQAMNTAVNRLIEESEIGYDRLVLLQKDAHGAITAIQTNMTEVNRLKGEILTAIDGEILSIGVSEIGIPLGSLLFPSVFSGKGPVIPIRVIAVSTSDAAFESVFSSAGINQTLHRILLHATANLTVLTPLGAQSVRADSEIIVAETVIVGTVPTSYTSIGSLNAG